MSNIPFRRRALKFPNARLFVHGQLSCGRTAAEAIAHSASEFGLLTDDELHAVLPVPPVSPCQCMATTRNILKKYCERRRGHLNGQKIDENEIWAILQEDALSFHEGSLEGANVERTMTQHECSKFAPALFDLMLQELLRYPL